MSEHPNVTVARSTYDAIAKGDIEIVRDLLTDDVVFHVPGHGPLGGDHVGKDQVLDYLSRFTSLTAGSQRFDIQEFLAGEDHTVALVNFHAERDGKTLDDRGAHLFRITDGKISERWSYPQDLYKIDAFFA